MSHPVTPRLPEDFIASLHAMLPEADVDHVVAHLRDDKPLCVRVNHLKWQDVEWLDWCRQHGIAPEPLDWYPGAWIVPADCRSDLTHSAPFSDGLFYIQNPSSLVPVYLLDPQPGETILDLTAAPGGKTLAIVDRMRNEGTVSAVEAVKGRFFKLREQLERHGATCVRTYLMDGREAGRKVPGRFDRVLLDAPCSSEARFVAGQPETWSHWSLRKVRECQRKQVGLLKSALQTLRPGGRLVYSTCSFAAEENELVIHKVLKRFKGAVRVVPVGLPLANIRPGLTAWQTQTLDPQLVHARRILPDKVMDGFFVCVLERQAHPE